VPSCKTPPKTQEQGKSPLIFWWTSAIQDPEAKPKASTFYRVHGQAVQLRDKVTRSNPAAGF